jgi:hypothetical protein
MTQEICSGEIWTDAHGFAAVTLPRLAERDLVVDVHAVTDGVTAEVATEPRQRRFTIATDEPHVRVAWRVCARRRQDTTQSSKGSSDDPAPRNATPTAPAPAPSARPPREGHRQRKERHNALATPEPDALHPRCGRRDRA